MSENITLYAYLDITNPMVAWEVAIGRIKSSCDNNKNNFGISLWQYDKLKSIQSNSQISHCLINELNLEIVRQRFFPKKVSRLKGLYFFETKKMAEIALERWQMQSKKKYISAVNFSANSLTFVDSEWITYCLIKQPVDNGWMSKYWNGDTYGTNPLTEILASGIGIIQNDSLRLEAYKKIMELWPNSILLLASACCAFKAKRMEEIALVKPALIETNKGIKVGFYINMKDFDLRMDDICDAVEECKKAGEAPPILSPSDKKILFSIPDMRNYSFLIRNQKASLLLKIINQNNSNRCDDS